MKTLADIVAANRAGAPVGLASYCTAQAEPLKVVLAAYAHDDEPVLIEASSRQVNQFGGYTGMTPAGFRNFIDILAAGEGVDPSRVLLGGDRLGPAPWRTEPAAVAMDKAAAMIAAYVDAGFSKLHFDASMACADDAALDEPTRAARTAELCAAAEAAAGGRPLSYVISTRSAGSSATSPMAGGLDATTPQALQEILELHEAAFARRGLRAALDRVVAVEVQPGIGYTDDRVLAFEPALAADLSDTIFDIPDAVFEVRATDYQTEPTLGELVRQHFGILKVGPELTFAFRQAVVAMAHLESHLSVDRSNLLAILAEEMDRAPVDWTNPSPAGPRTAAMRLFGLTDNARYYWARPRVAAALTRLLANIDNARPEIGLLTQYAPARGPAASRRLPLSSRIITDHVGQVVEKYRHASGLD